MSDVRMTEVGSVDGRLWQCGCGVEGLAANHAAASLALYFHIRSGHQPADRVVVMMPLADGETALFYPDGTTRTIRRGDTVRGSHPQFVIIDELAATQLAKENDGGE